jgi:hypothetical protein
MSGWWVETPLSLISWLAVAYRGGWVDGDERGGWMEKKGWVGGKEGVGGRGG